MNSTVKDLDDLIIDQLERHTYYSYDKSHGVILVEIYADYRDEVDRKTITEWCQADDPHKAFGDSLFEWYETSTWETEDEIVKAIRNNWTSKRFPFDENEEYITEWLREHIEYVYPEKHFLSQSATQITIMSSMTFIRIMTDGMRRPFRRKRPFCGSPDSRGTTSVN